MNRRQFVASIGAAAAAAMASGALAQATSPASQPRPAVSRRRRPNVIVIYTDDMDWGTGGLALKVLPFARRSFEHYASVPISGS